MPDGRSDIMAQAVFLAQLEAAKSTCSCNTCKILRRASKLMTAQFLGESKATPPAAALVPDAVETLELKEEE